MNRDCFTCAKSMGCPLTWMCYDDPESFDSNEVYGCSYEPKKKIETYNLNNYTDIHKKLFLRHGYLEKFLRGSRTYGTQNEDSDYDYGVIVEDDSLIIDQPNAFDNEKCDTRIHQVKLDCGDIEIVKECDFIKMIEEHEPFAIEPLMLDDNDFVRKYRKYLNINTWKLRCKFGQISNNSWSKAKKKMTVVEDYDMYCGVKSLFHSIRLLIFACSFVKGYIEEYEMETVRSLHNNIMNDMKSGFTWDDFNNKYKPIWKKWHHEMVILCPKPEEEYKDRKL